MKSTVVLDRLPFLLRDVLVDHLVGDVPRRDREVPTRPQMPPPELFPEVGELLKENPGRGAFEPRDNRADVLVGTVGEEQVDMVACDLPRENLEFPLHRDLAEEVAHPEGDRPDEDRFSVLRDPDPVDLAVKAGMRADPVFSHAPILPQPSLRLKARGFHHPRMRH